MQTHLQHLIGDQMLKVKKDSYGIGKQKQGEKQIASKPGQEEDVCGVTSGYRAELQLGTLFLKNQTVFGTFMGRNEDLRQIVDLASQGVIRGIIHQTFPLEEAARAHETMEGRNFFGKLVLTVP